MYSKTNESCGLEEKNEDHENIDTIETTTPPRKYEIVYPSVIFFLYFHAAALYGLYLCFTTAKWQTIVFGYILALASLFGITAGAHRLWAHKSYKAKLPLKLILLVLNSLAFQYTTTEWVRNHRLHHKYSDTDADPHNARRGFFFSHVGWLLVRKHPLVKEKGKTVDMSDIYADPLLKFQKKYAVPFIGTIFIVPSMVIPMYFWEETFNNSWHVAVMLRYVFSLNITFLVNSAAHMWGYKPYDKNIKPGQNITISILTHGEGFHNYHHVYPWDYRTAELGNNYFNLTTKLLDFFAWIGWAYDLKTVSPDIVKSRMKRTGDGTNLWGWGDRCQSEEQKEETIILKEHNY